MCSILIPIHPKYVDGIIKGTKTFELRRKIPRRKVDKMLIYSTSPVMKVVCEVEIEQTLTDKVDNLWEIVRDSSLVTFEEYKRYFDSNGLANAFQIGKVKLYDEPKQLSDLGINYTPQSFTYLD